MARLADVPQRALAKNPAQRSASIDAFVNAVAESETGAQTLSVADLAPLPMPPSRVNPRLSAPTDPGGDPLALQAQKSNDRERRYTKWLLKLGPAALVLTAVLVARGQHRKPDDLDRLQQQIDSLNQNHRTLAANFARLACNPDLKLILANVRAECLALLTSRPGGKQSQADRGDPLADQRLDWTVQWLLARQVPPGKLDRPLKFPSAIPTGELKPHDHPSPFEPHELSRAGWVFRVNC